MSFLKDLGDLPPPAALSLQTIRAKVEKRTSIDTAPCTGSAAAAAAACKPAANSGSSSSMSPKSSPVGETHRDSRRDSRDSTVHVLFSSVFEKSCVWLLFYAACFHHLASLLANFIRVDWQCVPFTMVQHATAKAVRSFNFLNRRLMESL